MIRIPPITGELVRLRQANAQGMDQTPVPIDVELAVLEQYPPALRRAFNDAAIKVNCLSFVDYFNWAIRNGHGEGRVLAKFRETEANEILVFAGQYRGRYKCDLPHIAASATVQRYGDPGPSRHPPRRTGKPIFQRRAIKRRHHEQGAIQNRLAGI
jgi:hypothetical protein